MSYNKFQFSNMYLRVYTFYLYSLLCATRMINFHIQATNDLPLVACKYYTYVEMKANNKEKSIPEKYGIVSSTFYCGSHKCR